MRRPVIARLRAAAEGTPASRVCCAVIWEAIKSAKLERPLVARRAMLGKPAELSRLDVAFAAIWELVFHAPSGAAVERGKWGRARLGACRSLLDAVRSRISLAWSRRVRDRGLLH